MKKILIILILSFLYSCSPTKFSKQVLIIPKSYRGEIWIFYDQTYNRGKFDKKRGKIIFYVPNDGIVFSKYSPNEVIDLEEYYEDGEKIYHTESMEQDEEIYMIGGSGGTLELPNKKMLKYSRYSIGNKKYQESILSKQNNYDYIVKKYEESLNKATH